MGIENKVWKMLLSALGISLDRREYGARQDERVLHAVRIGRACGGPSVGGLSPYTALAQDSRVHDVLTATLDDERNSLHSCTAAKT